MSYMLFALQLVLLGAVVVILVKKWRRTGDVGLVLLAATVGIWPFVEGAAKKFCQTQTLAVVNGKEAAFPFSMVRMHGTVSLGEVVSVWFSVLMCIQLALFLWVSCALYSRRNNAGPRP